MANVSLKRAYFPFQKSRRSLADVERDSKQTDETCYTGRIELLASFLQRDKKRFRMSYKPSFWTNELFSVRSRTSFFCKPAAQSIALWAAASKSGTRAELLSGLLCPSRVRYHDVMHKWDTSYCRRASSNSPYCKSLRLSRSETWLRLFQLKCDTWSWFSWWPDRAYSSRLSAAVASSISALPKPVSRATPETGFSELSGVFLHIRCFLEARSAYSALFTNTSTGLLEMAYFC